MVTLSVRNTFPHEDDVGPEIAVEDDDREAALKVGNLVKDLLSLRGDEEQLENYAKEKLKFAGVRKAHLDSIKIKIVRDTPKKIHIVVRELDMDLIQLETSGTKQQKMAAKRYLRAVGASVLKGCKY